MPGFVSCKERVLSLDGSCENEVVSEKLTRSTKPRYCLLLGPSLRKCRKSHHRCTLRTLPPSKAVVMLTMRGGNKVAHRLEHMYAAVPLNEL